MIPKLAYKNRRESDPVKEELEKLSERLKKHERKFEEHESRFKKHLHENEVKIDTLCQNTESLVEAWETLGGAVRFGTAIGKFVKWLGGFAVIIGIIDWLSRHGPE